MDDLDDLIKTKKAPKTKAKAKAKAASNDDGPAPKAKTEAKKAPKAKAKAKTKAKAASNDDEPAPKAKAQVKKEDGEEEEEETPKDLVKKAPEPRGGKRGSRLSVGWPVLTVLAMSAGLLALVAAQRRAKWLPAPHCVQLAGPTKKKKYICIIMHHKAKFLELLS